MTMDARRAIQVLATVGLFAGLVAARMMVESFPSAEAVQALATLVVNPKPAEAPDEGEASAIEPVETARVEPTPMPPTAAPGALAELPASKLDRRMPVRPTQDHLQRPGMRVIRMPVIRS